MHATIEYFSVEQETVAFNTLAENIACMEANIGGEKAKINTYEILVSPIRCLTHFPP